MKIIKIDLDLFQNEYCIFLINCTQEKMIKYLLQKYGFTVKPENGNTEGLYIKNKNLKFIWLKNFDYNTDDIRVLTHEIFHLAIDVLKEHNIKLCDQTEEVFALYQQSIFFKFENNKKQIFKEDNK